MMREIWIGSFSTRRNRRRSIRSDLSCITIWQQAGATIRVGWSMRMVSTSVPSVQPLRAGMGKHALGTCSQQRSDPLGEKRLALCPDENGTAYTGSAIVDKKNLLGHGKDALLFYHTAAGGKTSVPGLRRKTKCQLLPQTGLQRS